METNLGKIAELIAGVVESKEQNLVFKGVSNIDTAKESDLVIFSDLKLLGELLDSHCGAVIAQENIFIDNDLRKKITKPVIIVKNARVALMKLLEFFYGEKERAHFSGIHKTAVIDTGVKLGRGIAVGAYVVIEKNVSVEAGTVIYPHCYIGNDVSIGRNCVLFSNVTIYKGTIIGDNAIIHSGTVIGSDGFGYVTLEETHKKVLQLGIVEIGSNVELGSNVSIDRATLGKTVIGEGTKIDNLVHIGHNVKIGRNCLIAGQVGMAGSARIGKNVMMGGQVGIADHINIGDNAIIAAQSGVIGGVKQGEFVTGFPARPVKEFMKAQAALYKWTNKKQSPGK